MKAPTYNSPAPISEDEQLVFNDVRANVAIDTFLDPNPDYANSTLRRSKYELMIWLLYIPGVDPVGSSDYSEHTYDIGNTTL